jgi:hypothetical protein
MGAEKGIGVATLACWHLEKAFTKLLAAGYRKTSDRTGFPHENDLAYNCIAWAANDFAHWWWPQADSVWPFWSKREPQICNFVTAFRGLGYFVCDNSRLERGFEKIALYARRSIPTHMARQLMDGSWTSKCGPEEDITHFTLDALESYGPWPPHAEYGQPILYMKRLRIVGSLVRFFQDIYWQIHAVFKR